MPQGSTAVKDSSERTVVRLGKEESFVPSGDEFDLIVRAENMAQKGEYEELEDFAFSSWSPAHSHKISPQTHLYIVKNLLIPLGVELGVLKIEGS
jgi:hypothetical protein